MIKEIIASIILVTAISINLNLESTESKTFKCEFNENNLIFTYEIPENFKSVKYGADPCKGGLMLNYVPKNEKPESCSELRQISYTPEPLENVIDYLHFLSSAFDPDSQSSIQTANEHNINSCWGVFDHPNPRTPAHPTKTSAIFGCKIYSGKEVTLIILNMIMYDPKTTSPLQKEELKEKVETFFKNCKLNSKI